MTIYVIPNLLNCQGMYDKTSVFDMVHLTLLNI